MTRLLVFLFLSLTPTSVFAQGPPWWLPAIPDATARVHWQAPRVADPAWSILIFWTLHISPPTPPDPVHDILQSLRHEPGIHDITQAALRHAGLDRQASHSRQARARWSALAPSQWNLQGTLGQNIGNRLITRDEFGQDYLLTDTQLSDSQEDNLTTRLTLELRWEPKRMLYNPDELSTDQAHQRLIRQEYELLQTVRDIYYKRRQLQVQARLHPPEDWAQVAKIRIQIEELSAALDHYTGAWFSAQHQ